MAICGLVTNIHAVGYTHNGCAPLTLIIHQYCASSRLQAGQLRPWLVTLALREKLADMLHFLLARQILSDGMWETCRFRTIATCKVPMETVFPQVFVC